MRITPCPVCGRYIDIPSDHDKEKHVEMTQDEGGERTVLYNADPECDHYIQPQWSGVKCTKCSGWFCF